MLNCIVLYYIIVLPLNSMDLHVMVGSDHSNLCGFCNLPLGHGSFETARSVADCTGVKGTAAYMACGPTDTYSIYSNL